jgi:hypothetical protein
VGEGEGEGGGGECCEGKRAELRWERRLRILEVKINLKLVP